jgi:hypothetical protein
MCDYLIRESGNTMSDFFLYNQKELAQKIQTCEENKQRVLLIGVTYALLNFADEYGGPLNHTTIIETGGMKGRRKEITREELHILLKKKFPGAEICSEYGMTELLSQAYSIEQKFLCPPWMRILIREINDPLCVGKLNERGGINIIDLANLDSCSFIATSDLGIAYSDQTFEVLGRIDYSDLRGCNLLLN